MSPGNTVMLGCCDIGSASDIIRYVSELGYVFTGLAMDGERLLQQVAEYEPDIVLMDVIMPLYDARSVLKRIPDLPVSRFPHVVVMLRPGMFRLKEMFAEGSVVFYDKTLGIKALSEALRSALSGSRMSAEQLNRLTEQVKLTLLNLGIFPNARGSQYLIEAVIIFVDKYGHIDTISNDIYRPIAEKFHTQPANVERSIRAAIEGAWAKPNNMAMQLREFGNTIDSGRGKPTNSEFIARIAEKMLHGGHYEPID